MLNLFKHDYLYNLGDQKSNYSLFYLTISHSNVQGNEMKKIILIIGFFVGLHAYANDKCIDSKCHAGFKSKKFLHDPIQKDKCTSCHEVKEIPDKKHASKLLNNTNELCYKCHKNKKIISGFVHGALSNGDCMVCHDPHSSDTNKTFLTTEGNELCFMCHDDKKTDLTRPVVHPPAQDACTNCHNAHGSKFKNNLESDVPDLCFNCHDDIKEKIKNNKHKPVIEGKCTKCHTPHGSESKKLLLKSTKETCFTCHKNIQAKWKNLP
jgi:predicted CXXCH cytochrome family protein